MNYHPLVYCKNALLRRTHFCFLTHFKHLEDFFLKDGFIQLHIVRHSRTANCF